MLLRHVPLNCLPRVFVTKSIGPGRDKRTRAHVFLGKISARKVCPEEVHTHASPRLVAEEGTNARPGEAAEKRENAGADVALEGGSAAGTDADGFG